LFNEAVRAVSFYHWREENQAFSNAQF